MRRSLVPTLLALASVVVIGWVDYATGPEFGFSLFYLIPVALVAWYARRTSGLIAAVGGATAWLVSDLGYRPSLAASVWNGFTRLVIFVMVAILLDRVRSNSERLATVDRQREEYLRVLERELPGPIDALALVSRQIAATASAEERDAVRELRRRVRDLQFIAKDFLALGQLQSARLALTRTVTDLNQLARDVTPQLADSQRVILTLSAEPALVEADVDRLRQAVESVIRSALQHSTGDVLVAVRVEPQTASLDVSDRAAVSLRPGDESLFSAGGGADPRGVAAADRFLGLQLARLLMEAHGGQLVVERGGVLGSLVRLRLPRAQARPSLAQMGRT